VPRVRSVHAPARPKDPADSRDAGPRSAHAAGLLAPLVPLGGTTAHSTDPSHAAAGTYRTWATNFETSHQHRTDSRTLPSGSLAGSQRSSPAGAVSTERRMSGSPRASWPRDSASLPSGCTTTRTSSARSSSGADASHAFGFQQTRLPAQNAGRSMLFVPMATESRRRPGQDFFRSTTTERKVASPCIATREWPDAGRPVQRP
jgi:hypothetical protein